MSRIEPGGFEDIELTRGTVEADHPIFDQDWKERLKTARAQRKKVLSSRKADVLSTALAGPLRGKRTSERPKTKLSEEAPAENADPLRKALRYGPVYKLLLAFSAATGIGLGVTLGIGALGTFGAPGVLSDPQVMEAGGASDISAASAVPRVLTPVTPETSAGDVAGIWQGPGWENQPGLITQVAASLPRIDAVEYVSVPPDDVWTTSAPSVPALPSHLTEAGTLAGLTPRFFVHVPDGVADGRLQAYISQFEAEGIEVGSIGREAFRVSTTHLRYYSPAVADAAQSAATALGIEARDFSQDGLQTGRIEIWIAGRPKATQAEPAPQNNPIARFFGRLTNASN